MPSDLADRIAAHGRTVETVAAWIRSRIASDWDTAWRENLAEITDAWQRVGEPAYGLYNRELFRPIHNELPEVGLTCAPRLPGTMALSEEHWGPENFRERRMWSLLVDQQTAIPLGALVVRFYHDHTQLRLPDMPSMEAVAETDHAALRRIVRQDPSVWASRSDDDETP
jgi:hypothetical protein